MFLRKKKSEIEYDRMTISIRNVHDKNKKKTVLYLLFKTLKTKVAII